jgi:uncharacterized membrane protein YsdA (DUF1294 family)
MMDSTQCNHYVLPAFAVFFLVVNLIAFYRYWRDKIAAENGEWRISEVQLLLWRLFFFK